MLHLCIISSHAVRKRAVSVWEHWAWNSRGLLSFQGRSAVTAVNGELVHHMSALLTLHWWALCHLPMGIRRAVMAVGHEGNGWFGWAGLHFPKVILDEQVSRALPLEGQCSRGWRAPKWVLLLKTLYFVKTNKTSHERNLCLFLFFTSNLGFHQVMRTYKGTIKLFIAMSNADSPSTLVNLFSKNTCSLMHLYLK